jgi:hypothetical protein
MLAWIQDAFLSVVTFLTSIYDWFVRMHLLREPHQSLGGIALSLSCDPCLSAGKSAPT